MMCWEGGNTVRITVFEEKSVVEGAGEGVAVISYIFYK
jgi:hypothetical protein